MFADDPYGKSWMEVFGMIKYRVAQILQEKDWMLGEDLHTS